MKQSKNLRRTAILMVFMLFNMVTWAQDKAITEQEVKTWFEKYWVWVVAGAVLLLIIIISSVRKSRTRRTTTVIKDDKGHVKSVTTTEVRE